MKFKDLMIGDWFIDKSGWFVPEAVLMKTSDTEVMTLNWYNVEVEPFDADADVEFCSRFMTTLEECSKDTTRKPFAFDDFDKPDFRLEKHFDSIPMDAIFKGRGQTYYKRIDESHTLVVWSPKQETMGKIFERPDWETHVGTYYVCYVGLFQFPEDSLRFPYNEKSPSGFTF